MTDILTDSVLTMVAYDIPHDKIIPVGRDLGYEDIENWPEDKYMHDHFSSNRPDILVMKFLNGYVDRVGRGQRAAQSLLLTLRNHKLKDAELIIDAGKI